MRSVPGPARVMKSGIDTVRSIEGTIESDGQNQRAGALLPKCVICVVKVRANSPGLSAALANPLEHINCRILYDLGLCPNGSQIECRMYECVVDGTEHISLNMQPVRLTA